MTRPAPHQRPVRARALFAILLAVAPFTTAFASPAFAEDATSLLANPKRLDQVQQGCKVNAPWASQALCREAAEATRRRFRGVGVPYTPRHVEPFASHPHETLSAPDKPRRKLAPKAPAPMAPAPMASASRPSRTERRP